MRNVLIDAILTALFAAELSFHFLPAILHEVFGVAMAAAIIFHVAINRRRFKFALPLNVALTICAAVTLATGVCMSNYLFVDAVSFELRRNMTIHQLHVATPYLMLILIGVHVGLNWRELWRRTLHLIGAEEFYRRRRFLFRAAAIILAAFGVAELIMNRVADRILMKHIFATPATDLPAAVFVLMIIGGVALFAAITFLLNEKFFGRRRN